MFRKQPDPWEPQERFNGLSESDFNTLAKYNAECAHGIMHTPEWQEKMAALQHRFDTAECERERQWTLP
jgi:hypothetical protein